MADICGSDGGRLRKAAVRYVERCEEIKREITPSSATGSGDIEETDSLRGDMRRGQNLVKAAVALDSAGRIEEALAMCKHL